MYHTTFTGLEVINKESDSKKGIRNQNNIIPTGTRFGPYNKVKLGIIIIITYTFTISQHIICICI